MVHLLQVTYLKFPSFFIHLINKKNFQKLLGYIIEARRKDAPDWSEAARTIGPDCEGTVLGLREGEQLEFRVRAVNAGKFLKIDF